MSGVIRFLRRSWLSSLILVVVASPRSGAGGEPCCSGTGRALAVPTARVVPPPRPRGTLGTFYPTPYVFIRSNITASGGYTPLGMYGDQTTALYGPLSVMRSTSAPVLTYTRGYDGRAMLAPGTSFSTPNYPALTPVVYPTQANAYYGFRVSGNPPWWQNATNWVDQN
jgi:hypothetical protein